MRTSRILSLALATVLPLGLAGAIFFDHTPTFEGLPGASLVETKPSELTVSCLDVMVDPFSQDEGVRIEHVNLHNASATAKGHIQRLEGDHLADTYATLIVQGGGELRGASILPCEPPRREHWFAFGRTTPGEDTLVRLTNPTQAPIDVTIRAWGASGSLKEATHALTLPAQHAQTIRPGTFLPEEDHPVLSITTDGPAIGAWMFTSGLDGEVPQGATWQTSTHPSQRHVITGITTDQAHVRIVNTGQSDTIVTLTWITENNAVEIPGSTITMSGETVSEIPLPKAGKDYAALKVESTHTPIAAHVMTAVSGKKWPQGKNTWADRTVIAPTPSLSVIQLPRYQDLEHLTNAYAKTPILRQTSLETLEGIKLTRATLIITNLAEAPATLTPAKGGKPLTVGGQRTQHFDVGELTSKAPGAVRLESDQDVFAVLALDLETPTGDVKATLPLQTLNLESSRVKLTFND